MKGALQVVTLDCWKDRISDLIKLFKAITFSHIYKEDNEEADCLSKQALQKQSGKITYNLWEYNHEGSTMFLKLY